MHWLTRWMFVLALLTSQAAVAGDASGPYDSCGESDKKDGMSQIGLQPDALYRCTTTGGTRKWIPQSLVVGKTPTTCNANNAGRLYWDGSALVLKVCDGTGAATLAASGGNVILGATATGPTRKPLPTRLRAFSAPQAVRLPSALRARSFCVFCQVASWQSVQTTQALTPVLLAFTSTTPVRTMDLISI